MATIEEKITELAAMGPKLAAVFGATSEILGLLRDGATDKANPEILTGDSVADASILRALGVEQTIKDKWNVDLCQVLDLLGFLGMAFPEIAGFFKEI